MNYLPRSALPHLLNEAADIHDKMTKSTFQEIVGLSILDDNHWSQVPLKVTFGITSINQMMHAAFIAAWSHTALNYQDAFLI